jgi:aryl-alcohol dehydrogenase-like predicted oxidoreductase
VQGGLIVRRVAVSNLEGGASAVGMGCASLGSRIGRREGLRSLDRAFDVGVTWYDVAPSYGDSGAESILGEFIRGKRDKVQLCTKVGILPARTPFAMRAAKPIIRFAVDTIPMLRKYVAGARPRAAKSAITPEIISLSIDASLKRLGTDHVDVLALHDADLSEVVREDILAALQRITRLGKAKTISIASSLEPGLIGVAHSDVYGIVQVANNPFQPSITRATEHLPKGRPITFVTHSAYGAFGALHRLCEKIKSTPAKQQILWDEGYSGNTQEVAAAFLADYALATNGTGISLFSMFKKQHLDFNLRRLEKVPAKARVEKIVQALIA